MGVIDKTGPTTDPAAEVLPPAHHGAHPTGVKSGLIFPEGIQTGRNTAGGDPEVAVRAMNRELQDKGVLLTTVEDIVNWVTDIWEKFQLGWRILWDKVNQVVTTIWNAIKAAAKAVWGALTGYFRTVLGIYRAIFTAAWNAIRMIRAFLKTLSLNAPRN